MPCEEGCCPREKRDVADAHLGWAPCAEPQEVSPPPEEEYLEIDYDSGIEESSQYVFSQRPYCRNMAAACCSHDNEEKNECSGGCAREQKQHDKGPYACDQPPVFRGWRLQQQQQEETLPPGCGRAALVILLSEAHRRHLAHLRCRGTSEEGVAEARRRWRTVSDRLLEEFEEWGYFAARMKFHKMYLFDLVDNFFDSGSRVIELQRNKEHVLRRLGELKKRNQFFLKPEAELPLVHAAAPARTAGEGAATARPTAAAASLTVMTVARLNELPCTACQKQLETEPGDILSPSLDSSLGSGGGASSSPCSSDTEEDGDACCSPPTTSYGSWLPAPCH
ncbi:uncharacterized protein Tco025E_00627 [Trypanosoma conorhini]|uniref:Uncharacterized protein n=1 Tax=Trypanosoma conorhini TaxID=83891 RepID=A0A422QAZ4_9TRYP|nr:uncharacterized protein Tco025E_00627 [Trypanosoma conorhini]RNF27129.1 hypothetical protein Tco025E_00627 [Trypanosoma conorhini]